MHGIKLSLSIVVIVYFDTLNLNHINQFMGQSSKCHRAHTSRVMTNVFNYNEVFKFCLINQSRIWNYNRARKFNYNKAQVFFVKTKKCYTV